MSIMSKHLWFSALVMPIAIFNGANAQEHAFGFGRTATKDEIVRADIDVRYDGLGLPVGQGTATEGKQTYYAKCVACHGAALEGNKQLYIKPLKSDKRHAINNRPFAPPIYAYIRRSMPLTEPGSLTNDEVYGLVAYLLQETGIRDQSDEPLDANSLRRIRMPNRDNFVPEKNSGVTLPR